jgi:hypothetical protein
VRYRGKQANAAGGGSSSGKRESGGGYFESSEVMAAPTVGCGREAKGWTEKRHAVHFGEEVAWVEKVANAGSVVAVGRGSRKGEGNGGADLAMTGGKKEGGRVWAGSRQCV